MKSITFLLLSLFQYSILNAQTIYTLELIDPATYTTSCGTVNPTNWAVNNSNCSLTTASVVTDTAPAAQTYTAVVIISGTSMDSNDSAVICYAVNGAWTTQKVYHAAPVFCSYQYIFSITANANSAICVSVNFFNNGVSEQWEIANAGITLVKQIIILPVEMLSFKGEPAGDAVRLNWATGSETENDFFTLEVSGNGTSFTPIGKIPAAGNSSSTREYSFIDHDPVEGVNYYRLKQTDRNGTERYCSDIISCDYSQALPHFSIFPNPLNNSQLHVCTEKCPDDIELTVTDMAGKKILTTAFRLNAKNETIELPDAWSRLEPGIYLVNSTLGTESYRQKIFVR